jgi:hypothetical protein
LARNFARNLARNLARNFARTRGQNLGQNLGQDLGQDLGQPPAIRTRSTFGPPVIAPNCLSHNGVKGPQIQSLL